MDQDDGRANRVEPQTLAFLQAVEVQDGAPIQTLTPTAARSRLAAIQRNVQITKMPVAIEERVINVGPTGQLKLRLVRPSGNTGRPLPGILYLHGGGWVLGNKETHDRLVREIECRFAGLSQSVSEKNTRSDASRRNAGPALRVFSGAERPGCITTPSVVTSKNLVSEYHLSI